MNEIEFEPVLDALVEVREQLFREGPVAHAHSIKAIDAFIDRPDPEHIEAVAKFVIQETANVKGGAVERLRLTIDPPTAA